MKSPLFCYSAAPRPPSPVVAVSSSPSSSFLSPSSLLSPPSNLNIQAASHSITDQINLFKECIEELAERDLYNLLNDIIYEVFGLGNAKGWGLDKLKLRVFGDQKQIYSEQQNAYYFLYHNGPIFHLCYKLLSNSLFKFQVFFSDLPIGVSRKIEKSLARSYYGSRFLYHMDSNLPIGLTFNSFEYYMFHFALYGLKLTTDDNMNVDPNQQSVYRCLSEEYLNHFLPLDSPASMVPPQLQFSVLSTVSSQKQQCATSSKSLTFIKRDIACNELANDKVESSSWTLTSEATWRSELVAFFFADLWLNYNVYAVPSSDLTKLIRCFIKHLHMYSNCAEKKPLDNLRPVLIARHGITIYQYLAYYMDHWPQDFSFRLLLENWLSYIQPWRYEETIKQQPNNTESEINNKWRVFIIRNLLCYTKLFHLAIKRFSCIDICSPRYSTMVFRMLKVFTHPYLLKIVLDVEHMYISNQLQHKKWNVLLSECLAEAEGPMFKYEVMFSEERNHEYKLFYTKLQKSLEHIAVELHRFQQDKKERTNSSVLGFLFTPRKSKISNYTISEWEDIQTDLKSSLAFMEQIINVNVMTTPMMADLSAWSISGVSSCNTTSNVFSKGHSFIQSFEHSTSNLSSKAVIHAKEWEMDPDFIGTLSHENEFLVNLSMKLRNTVECYWNSYILKFSTEETILAGVIRQVILRAPMKIFSYEPRQDGSGKRVRTPKIVPPTVSFRWMASYFVLAWILFLLTLVMVFDSVQFWLCFMGFIYFIYLCVKYLIGYAPPFKWDNLHEN